MQNLDDVPKHRPNHFLEEIDGEFLLYGKVSKKAHYLNETASIIWKLCDGNHTVGQIIDELSEAYPESPDVAADVMQTLDRLVSEATLTVDKPSDSEAKH